MISSSFPTFLDLLMEPMKANLIVSITALMLWPQLAAAQPWQRHTIDNSSRGADGVRLADVNGDDLQDIVTGWEEGGVIRVYINPGRKLAKQTWPAVTVGKVKSPEDAVFADLDGDGATDVVSSCEGRTRTMFIHWAPSDRKKYMDASSWQTASIPCTEQKQMWMFALPMQVDGRHGLDLIVSSKGGGATIGWLQAPEDPRDVAAWKFHTLYNAGWIMSLQAHDMDGDGDQDVLASDRKGKNRGILWLENPGAKQTQSGVAWKIHRAGASDREVMFLTVTDLDQNGQGDVLCTVRGNGISLLKRDRETNPEWRHQEIAMPPNCGTGKGVAVDDIDLDGNLDIVFSCENASGGKSGMRWLSNEGGQWQDHEISGPKGVKFDRIELLDLDGDGDRDVICCEERDNLGVIWYENPTK